MNASSIDWDRRRKAEASLPRWLKTYFHEIFFLPWTREQLSWLDCLQEKLRSDNQRVAVAAGALERRCGNSSILFGTTLFAVLTRKRRFVGIMSERTTNACERLDDIELKLEQTALLAADYPQSRKPLRKSRGSMIVTVAADGVFHEALLRAAFAGHSFRGETWQSSTHSGRLRPDLLVYDD